VELLELPMLLARCREGDAAAWRALFDAHFAFVHRVARRLGTPESEVDDLCQETFMVVFKNLERFSTGSFEGWLYRIVSNLAASRHRKRRFLRKLSHLVGLESPDEPVDTQGPEALVRQQEVAGEVRRILEGMTAKKRDVFVLYELEGLSGAEISERLKCSVETVWTRLHYARKDFTRLTRQRELTQDKGRSP
jgi:RNA polymerase sigma-70 factor, ECF subfamily